jgi:hypothetical protein
MNPLPPALGEGMGRGLFVFLENEKIIKNM